MEKLRTPKKLSWNDVIFVSLMFVLFTVKFKIFYSALRLGGFDLCFALVSAAVVLSVYGVVNLVSPKAAKIILVIFYFVFSIMMAVDGVYFKYMSKMTSAKQLKVIWMLEGVSDSVMDLLTFKHILQVIDLPLWVIWLINRGFVHRKTPAVSEKLGDKKINRFIVSGVAAVLAALFLMYSFVLKDFRSNYMENEIIHYHFKDLAYSFFLEEPKKEVDLDQYVQKPKPVEPGVEPLPDTTEVDPYYGIAEGRNVIIIQVEALQNFVFGAEYEGQVLMPFLNTVLENDTLYFPNYYYQIGGGNTADAEFAVNNSLFGCESNATYMEYPDNNYYGLPWILKDNGYTGAYAFHGYVGDFWNREKAYPGQGFDDFTSLEDFEETEMFPMGLSDMEFFRQSTEIMKTYEEPFYSFMITVSSHFPYALPLEARDIEEKAEDVGTLFGLYIQAANYVDRAIEQFFDELKEAGLYDNSIIVIYGDHYALSNTDHENSARVKDMLGRDYTIYDVFNVPLIIHIPGLEKAETIEKAGGHIDVLPTLLYLLGLENNKSVMFGSNLLDGEEGIVCEQTHMQIGSFISNKVFFKKPYNNILTNYDAYEYGTMERLNPEDFFDISDWAMNRVLDCKAILENDTVIFDSTED